MALSESTTAFAAALTVAADALTARVARTPAGSVLHCNAPGDRCGRRIGGHCGDARTPVQDVGFGRQRRQRRRRDTLPQPAGHGGAWGGGAQ